MKVLQVKDYNNLEMQKYDKKCQEWKNNGGYNSREYFPQQAFYGFYTNHGQFRLTGYVAFENNRAIWRKTKQKAMEAYINKYRI